MLASRPKPEITAVSSEGKVTPDDGSDVEMGMSVFIKLSPEYSEYAGHRKIIAVKGRTFRECLESLIDRFPVFRSLLFDSDHHLTALVICQDEVIVHAKLDRPLTHQGEILLRPMVYGG